MKKTLDTIGILLIIVGGLNWGLVGLFNFNLVEAIFGGFTILARLVYILVAIAAVYMLIRSPVLVKLYRPHHPHMPSQA